MSSSSSQLICECLARRAQTCCALCAGAEEEPRPGKKCAGVDLVDLDARELEGPDDGIAEGLEAVGLVTDRQEGHDRAVVVGGADAELRARQETNPDHPGRALRGLPLTSDAASREKPEPAVLPYEVVVEGDEGDSGVHGAPGRWLLLQLGLSVRTRGYEILILSCAARTRGVRAAGARSPT